MDDPYPCGMGLDLDWEPTSLEALSIVTTHRLHQLSQGVMEIRGGLGMEMG